MPIKYKITYQPARYIVSPGTSSQGFKHFLVIDAETRQPVAWAFDENMAQTICLSLDMLGAMATGDRARVRDLGKMLDIWGRGQ